MKYILLMTSLLYADPITDYINNINTRLDNLNAIALQSQQNINDGQKILEYRATRASRFFGQSTAGSIATSSIDFGTTSKGVTEVGFGTGVSSSYISKVYAGAIAVKHGITDDSAIIVKGWKSDGSSYSIGAGMVIRL